MKPPWWFCCGWWSPWCVLDRVTRCKVRRVCDAHDFAITGEYQDEDGYAFLRSEPRTGRALAWLRLRHLALDGACRLAHAARLRGPRHQHLDVACAGLWPCWEFEDVDLERISYDHAYRRDAVTTPVILSRPPDEAP